MDETSTFAAPEELTQFLNDYLDIPSIAGKAKTVVDICNFIETQPNQMELIIWTEANLLHQSLDGQPDDARYSVVDGNKANSVYFAQLLPQTTGTSEVMLYNLYTYALMQAAITGDGEGEALEVGEVQDIMEYLEHNFRYTSSVFSDCHKPYIALVNASALHDVASICHTEKLGEDMRQDIFLFRMPTENDDAHELLIESFFSVLASAAMNASNPNNPGKVPNRILAHLIDHGCSNLSEMNEHTQFQTVSDMLGEGLLSVSPYCTEHIRKSISKNDLEFYKTMAQAAIFSAGAK